LKARIKTAKVFNSLLEMQVLARLYKCVFLVFCKEEVYVKSRKKIGLVGALNAAIKGLIYKDYETPDLFASPVSLVDLRERPIFGPDPEPQVYRCGEGCEDPKCRDES
jgi:hypothetical protein